MQVFDFHLISVFAKNHSSWFYCISLYLTIDTLSIKAFKNHRAHIYIKHLTVDNLLCF